MIKIFSKKSFIFKLNDKEFKVQYENFAEVPSELMQNPFVIAAVKDKSIIIMEDLRTIDKKAVENGDALKKELDEYTVNELKVYAEDNGIDLGKAKTKSEILAKIKEVEE